MPSIRLSAIAALSASALLLAGCNDASSGMTMSDSALSVAPNSAAATLPGDGGNPGGMGRAGAPSTNSAADHYAFDGRNAGGMSSASSPAFDSAADTFAFDHGH